MGVGAGSPGCGMGGRAVIRGIFVAGSGFRVGGRTAGGGLISVFQGFFASIGEIFILAGRLGARLSFYGTFLIFSNFLISFDNSSGILYIPCLKVIIAHRFTCG